MKRRDLLKAAAVSGSAIGAGSTLMGAPAVAQSENGATGTRRPNILFIIVDQLRFPSVFPNGTDTVDGFLKQYMPNLFSLWQGGVKFGNHFTAGNACTPARGTIITGLYTQQSWLCATILSTPQITNPAVLLMPQLKPAYPTYGRLLRAIGYQTPYVGKWHVSIITKDGPKLEPYGFDYLTYPDPTGSNLQGTYGDEPDGYLNDQTIADQATAWLTQNGASTTPWCLTVSLVNPHDKEFFWAGTEFQTYNNLFAPGGDFQPFTFYSQQGLSGPPYISWDIDQLKTPPVLGFDPVPPNWESTQQIQAGRKPSSQIYGRIFQSAVWGGISEDQTQTAFSVAPYPNLAPYPDLAPDPTTGKYTGIAIAPFSYWERNQDSYVQIMQVVDQRIGDVLGTLNALPDNVKNNTVVVFTADHGEYAGAHGYVSGKVASCYDEAWHVPLIVHDRSGRFTNQVDVVRTGLTSSVDVMPLLVSLGHNNSRAWISGRLDQIYGGRQDLNAMLSSTAAPGRPFVLLATDESAPGYYNFNNSPGHILGMRTPDAKLGTYSNWSGLTANIEAASAEYEFYDYTSTDGHLELNSLPDDPRAAAALVELFSTIVPNELRAPLPGVLGQVQTVAKAQYLVYNALIRNMNQSSSISPRQLVAQLGYGLMF